MYGKILSDQEWKGFIEKVNDFKTHQAHYIPHWPVRKDSDTTPIRIIYDCNCKLSSRHPSLSNCLPVGPPFLNHLCAILLRFHQYVYAFSADIEKAFLCAELNELGRNYTCFLGSLTHRAQITCSNHTDLRLSYWLAVHYAFMLNAALTFNLQQNLLPMSTYALRNLYVDNVVSGCDTKQEAHQYF